MEADAAQPKKGFGKKFGVGRIAPPELRDLPKPSEEALGMRAGPITSVARAMFANPSKKPVKKNIKKAATPPKAVKAPIVLTEELEGVQEPEKAEKAEKAEEMPKEEDKELADMLDAADIKGLTGELKEMGDLIIENETTNLYNTEVPTAYVPQTRRGFSSFINGTFTEFELPDGPINIPEGEKYYPYQKFVRDYMRKESPYRGILVYHGLGSGKTCTSIAASEALYASAKKKIIVMTPFSLKKNFLSEISFCGFRHFQLNNFWVSLDPKDPTTTLFANQILGLSGKYLKTARHVWVPDFRKPQSESNYSALPDDDRTEIRQQILSIVEWHPEKNPSGRIKFISYNGISAKKLMAMACDPNPRKFFDDAVIVIDEIHNLIRLMQGNIQPYLTKAGPGGKKVRRTVPVEEISHERWSPTLCKEGTKLYNRGYLFYRLLVDAQRSKIVGLSGTPLVNFPEELGILSNVLHGYITTIEGIIQQGGIIDKANDIGFKHPFTDYVKAKKDPAGGGTHVLLTLLPPGTRKVENDIGVERIPEEETPPSFQEIIESIQKSYTDAGIPFSGNLKPSSKELLPPFGDSFREKFIAGDIVKNKGVLITRLTGLISFYKGSRLELMPSVKTDEIVSCFFSLYAQKAYSFKRSTEVKSEVESKGKTTVDAVFAEVYELGDSAGANNYKMGSRQACNFAFPLTVSRPSASAKEGLEEAEAGEAIAGIITLVDEQKEVEEGEVDIQLEDEEDNIIEVAKEDAEIKVSMYDEDEHGKKKEQSAVPITAGNETNELIREHYASLGQPVPAEYVGLGAKDNAERNAFVKKYNDAGGRPWQEGDEEPPPPSAKNKTQKATSEPGISSTEIHFGMKIDNKYKALSNFAITPFMITTAGETNTYPSVEHYYQSMKFQGVERPWQKEVREAPTPENAREMGTSKGHKVSPSFKDSSIRFYMKRALEVKFATKELETLLLSTGNKRLIQAESERPRQA